MICCPKLLFISIYIVRGFFFKNWSHEGKNFLQDKFESCVFAMKTPVATAFLKEPPF